MPPFTVLCAPNAFKESLSAAEAASAMARGVRSAFPQARVIECPVSDGGDGLLDVVCAAVGAERREATVTDPLGRATTADWALHRSTGVVEMARASGLVLLRPDERNPLETSTVGTGELLAAALGAGADRLLLGIGGSATNDGGMGLATALGARFLDARGRELTPAGRHLPRVASIEGLDNLPTVPCDVICDVDNPLLGPMGCAAVYAPQKGATAEQVRMLEAGMAAFARVVERTVGRELRDTPGAGAAGGLGFGLMAFLGARLRPGSEAVLDLVDFDASLARASVVLTGEGRMDAQTFQGKAPATVASRAHRRGIPVVAMAGSVAPGVTGFDRVVCINPPGLPLEQALGRAASLLEAATRETLLGWDHPALPSPA